MRPIVTDGIAWSVDWSATIVSPAKTAEAIEMPFGVLTRLGPRNHLFHDLLLRSYLYHYVWSVITAHKSHSREAWQ